MEHEYVMEAPAKEEPQQDTAEAHDDGFSFQESDVNSREENPILDMFG